MASKLLQSPSAVQSSSNRKKKKKAKVARVSRLQKPEHLTLEEWQRELRRQFGREQAFVIKNVGNESFFTEFQVTNPASKNTYRVAIRGTLPGENFCSCPDFATNALGTCKHVENVLARLEKKRGGKSALRAGFQPSYSEIYLVYGARREVRFRPGTECPVELARLATRYFDADGTLPAEAMQRFPRFLTDAAKHQHELRCYDDALGFIAEARDRVRRQELITAAFPQGIKSAAFNKLLQVPLYEYQREGALFAAKAGRCLIGDEMGLGKTIQAIAAAEIMARHLGISRVLVICPTSLKYQWQREIGKVAQRAATIIGGSQGERQAGYLTESFFKITNYDTVHSDIEHVAKWQPDLVILDEAQRIKNWNTRVARSVKKITSPYAIVLTGTPLENRLEELVSIVQFIDLHRLGPTYRMMHDHQVTDQGGKVVGYRDLDKIGQALAPILIRRQKSQVLKQLPDRLDKHLFVPMTPEQMNHHRENQDVVARIVQRWRKMKFLTEADQRRLMIALQNMRMSCDSTYLLDQETDFGVKADELATLLDETFEDPATKVVVFSQWVRMHEVLARRFVGKKWEHVLFHGGVPTPKRNDLVNRFREDPTCRTFLATDAGGVGLNLQHANVVINVDLPWNPAVLEQRIGRVHRLGQTQPVRVVNFVAQGTIEHGMLSLLKFKKSLFAGVLDGGDSEVFMGGSRLTKFMESVEKATGDIPNTPVEQPPITPETNRQAPGTSTGAKPSAAQAGDPWAGLLQTGLALLEQVAKAARAGNKSPGNAPSQALVGRDPGTGETFLRLPMPDPDTLDQLLKSVGTILEKLRK